MRLSLVQRLRASLAALAGQTPAGADEPEVEDAETWPIPAEAMAVHVVSEHAAVRLEAGRLSIAIDGGAPQSVRMDDVAALMLHGAASVSTPALLALMRRGAPVLWHGFDGRLIGQTLGLGGAAPELREAQYAAAGGPAGRQIAHTLVAAKIANARRLLLRRRGAGDPAARQLAALAAALPTAESLARLRGLEGAAARAWFGAWPGLMEAAPAHLRFAGRSRRPPADPLNAALSYLYAVLHGRCVAAAVGAGLDPMAGFLHDRRAGRAALALDLMEPFRPLVVDGPLIAAANNGELPQAAFEQANGGWRLSAVGRRAALALFERRLAQTGRARGGGPPVAYRQAITRQARSLATALRQGRPFEAFTPDN